jgi:protein-arginine kinase activator protein McsA
MTDEEIERIAEAVFQKLLKRQEEWDATFDEQIYEGNGLSAAMNIAIQIALAKETLNLLIEQENYEEAAKVKKDLMLLDEKLKKLNN